MTLPNPYAQEQLPIFEVDLGAFFASVEQDVASSRTRRNQPQLVPEGKILLGEENVPRMDQYTAPMIVVVPVGTRYEAAQARDNNTSPLPLPFILKAQYIECEAHCWGYDDPEQRDTRFSFSSSLELWRQLYVAMVAENEGVWNIRETAGRWVQKQDINRLGRVLIVEFGIYTYVVDDPPIYVPMQTASNPGATVAITANLVSADGSEVQEEAEFTTP